MATSGYSMVATHEVPLHASRGIDRLRPLRIEKIATVAMLFYTTGAVVPLLIGTTDSEAPSPIRPLDLVIKVTLYAAVFLFVSLRWRSFARGIWDTKWIHAPVFIAIISMAWSQYPSLTLRGTLVLIATTIFGVYFGVRYTIPQQMRLLSWVFLSAIIASFFFAICLPMYGVEHTFNIGDWQGAFIQKNNLAQMMMLAFLVFLFARPWISRPFRCVGLVGSISLIILSGSATGIIIFCVIVGTLPLYKLIRAPSNLVIAVILGLLLLGSLLVLTTSPAEVFQLLDRSPDMTGRTELWNAVLISIGKRPLLGYGFSAFWVGMNGESASVIKAAGWMAGYSHDGFLDLLLQEGLLGLFAFLAGYLILWRRALAFLSRTTGPAPLWLCTYLAFLLLYNITEGSILEQNNVLWILYVTTAVNLFAVTYRQVLPRREVQ